LVLANVIHHFAPAGVAHVVFDIEADRKKHGGRNTFG
jgi:hypothetical protein